MSNNLQRLEKLHGFLSDACAFARARGRQRHEADGWMAASKRLSDGRVWTIEFPALDEDDRSPLHAVGAEGCEPEVCGYVLASVMKEAGLEPKDLTSPYDQGADALYEVNLWTPGLGSAVMTEFHHDDLSRLIDSVWRLYSVWLCVDLLESPLAGGVMTADQVDPRVVSLLKKHGQTVPPGLLLEARAKELFPPLALAA